MDELTFYQALVEAAKAGRAMAVATVVRTAGSVPRHAGSKMLIDPVGELIGTIGGGCGEAEVIEAAAGVVRTGQSCMVHVTLTDPINSWSPAVCGGTMDIFLEPLSPAGRSGS